MDFKQKIVRIFNLKPDSPISGFPGGKIIHINDAYSSMISVLIEFLTKEIVKNNITEGAITEGIENFLDKAKDGIIIISEEIPKTYLDPFYSELIGFTNLVIEDLNEYLAKQPLNLAQSLFGIPKSEFLDIVKIHFQQLRGFIIKLKSEKEFQDATYKHFYIQNGIIHWNSTMPLLGVILNMVSKKRKLNFSSPPEMVRYFMDEKPLINIGSKEIRTLHSAVRNSNIEALKPSDKKFLAQYSEEFIILDKKRKI